MRLTILIRCRAASTPSVAEKVELVLRADQAARAYDPRIKEVRASYADELRHILIIGSDGTFAEDVQPLSRMSVFVIARVGRDLGSRHRRRRRTPRHGSLSHRKNARALRPAKRRGRPSFN